MPEITDWSDLTYDYVPVVKVYRPAPDAEPETVRFELRDDVPTSIMVRVFGIGALEAKYRAALSETDAAGQSREPDYEAAVAAMERMEAEVLRALAGIFHHTYAETSVPEWEGELARIFTGAERLALVQRFFTRSRSLPTRPNASAARPSAVGASQTTRVSTAPTARNPLKTPLKPTKGHTAPGGQGATRGRSGRSASAVDADDPEGPDEA